MAKLAKRTFLDKNTSSSINRKKLAANSCPGYTFMTSQARTATSIFSSWRRERRRLCPCSGWFPVTLRMSCLTAFHQIQPALRHLDQVYLDKFNNDKSVIQICLAQTYYIQMFFSNALILSDGWQKRSLVHKISTTYSQKFYCYYGMSEGRKLREHQLTIFICGKWLVKPRQIKQKYLSTLAWSTIHTLV